MDELKPKALIEYSTPKNFGIVFSIVFYNRNLVKFFLDLPQSHFR